MSFSLLLLGLYSIFWIRTLSSSYLYTRWRLYSSCSAGLVLFFRFHCPLSCEIDCDHSYASWTGVAVPHSVEHLLLSDERTSALSPNEDEIAPCQKKKQLVSCGRSALVARAFQPDQRRPAPRSECQHWTGRSTWSCQVDYITGSHQYHHPGDGDGLEARPP